MAAVDFKELESLQELLVQVMKDELAYYKKEGIPVPSSDKVAIITLLKNNAVVSTPRSSEELASLREEFTNTKRGDRLAKLRAAIGSDVEDADNVISISR